MAEVRRGVDARRDRYRRRAGQWQSPRPPAGSRRNGRGGKYRSRAQQRNRDETDGRQVIQGDHLRAGQSDKYRRVESARGGSGKRLVKPLKGFTLPTVIRMV